MRKMLVLLAAALSIPLAAQAQVSAFVGLPLTATQETTPPNSTGHGNVTVLYDASTKVLMYSIVYQLNPGSTATAAHFHGPAQLGANAPVAIGLPTTPTGNAGKVTGTVTLTAAQEADLLAGRWYFNLHSTLAAGGELRAQLIENSNALTSATFVNGKLTVPVVLVPGVAGTASFGGLELVYTGPGATFNATAITPLR